MYQIKVYQRKNKDLPFDDWLEDQDSTIKNMILAKLQRISLGNFGICKFLGDGISEIKIDIGPGYRIYYSLIGTTLVLLLCAGTKRTQQKDIEKAQEYLKDYKARGSK
jgi:putative addiction module killer protein